MLTWRDYTFWSRLYFAHVERDLQLKAVREGVRPANVTPERWKAMVRHFERGLLDVPSLQDFDGR